MAGARAPLACGSLRGPVDLEDAIVEGADGGRDDAGLLPLPWSSGHGADVMKRIAAPMVGGLASSFALELLVYPALFAIWKRRELRGAGPRPA